VSARSRGEAVVDADPERLDLYRRFGFGPPEGARWERFMIRQRGAA